MVPRIDSFDDVVLGVGEELEAGRRLIQTKKP